MINCNSDSDSNLHLNWLCIRISSKPQYVQLKNGLMEVEELKQLMQQQALSYSLTLPDSAPQCQVLRRNTLDLDSSEEERKKGFMKSIRKLYVKYLDPSVAVLEVNIGYRTRKMIMDVFESLDNLKSCPFKAVLPLLDKAAVEISILMLDSLGRFKTTKEFIKLMKTRTTTK